MKPEKVWGEKNPRYSNHRIGPKNVGLPASSVTSSPMYTDPLHNYDANLNDICFVRR